MTFFTRQQIPALVSDALYQAERELLSAQHNLEHYESVVHMLKKRITRLKSTTQQASPATSKEPHHGNEKVLASDPSSTPRSSGRYGIVGSAEKLASLQHEEGGVAATGKKVR